MKLSKLVIPRSTLILTRSRLILIIILILILIAKAYGVFFKSVVLHIDKKSNLPAGNGTGYLDLHHHQNVDVNDCVEALQGQDCSGRPLRVHSTIDHDIVSKKRRSSQGVQRYFGLDLTIKCLNCGEVGHKQADCTNETIPTPCHLCAGKDHDAIDCPNITCYRCGQFGHHSRSCSNFRMQKAILCTLCGSSTHDNRHCHHQHPNDKVEGKHIRCMVCYKYGHASCVPLEAPKNKNIYCPNCGVKGHHVDYPGLTSQSCKIPRFDAYNRFNQLLREVDDDQGTIEDKNNLYRQLLRSSSHSNYDKDLHLFPSLCNDNNNNNNDNNYNGNNNNRNNYNRRHSFSNDSNSNYRKHINYHDDNINNNYYDDYDDHDNDNRKRFRKSLPLPSQSRSVTFNDIDGSNTYIYNSNHNASRNKRTRFH